ncbi:gluconokinase [Salibacterium salarium]|nr:gluconokinase [Salibacterium salarium]
MKAVIGIDIGTTSAKVVIFRPNGSVITEAESSYPVLEPQPGHMEQDPHEIEQALIDALHEAIADSGLSASSIQAAGISSAMHSLICVDESLTPLTNVLIWSDRRSVPQVERLRASDRKTLYENTGTPIHPMSPLLKLRWMYDESFVPYQTAASYISMKEYILRKWFHQDVVDYATASASGLFNIHRLEWDQDALNYAGISAEQLSTPVPPTHIVTGLNKDIARQTGLQQDIPIAVGASDGPLANLGVGAVDDSKTVVTVGTSGAVRQFVNKPFLDPDERVFCYAVSENQYIMGGPTNNGGNVLDWLQHTLQSPDKQPGVSDVESYLQMAGDIKAGSNGLLFLPYLNGERAPHWDATLKGSFFGLSHSHTQAHMARAGLEGVIYALYSIQEAIDTLGHSSDTIYANGGFARSELWLQILADVFGRTVKVPVSHQSSAWGAACTALIAIGSLSSYEEGTKDIAFQTSIPSQDMNNAAYRELYHFFKRLTEQTSTIARDMQHFQQ